jgi:hypothetical protein
MDEINNLKSKISQLETDKKILENGLKRSLKLQSHYAKLLNIYDDGERVGFDTIDEWLNRLARIPIYVK